MTSAPHFLHLSDCENYQNRLIPIVAVEDTAQGEHGSIHCFDTTSVSKMEEASERQFWLVELVIYRAEMNVMRECLLSIPAVPECTQGEPVEPREGSTALLSFTGSQMLHRGQRGPIVKNLKQPVGVAEARPVNNHNHLK